MTETQRRIVAEAWAFRTGVEREAADRFARLATAISRFDAPSPLPALMRRAILSPRDRLLVHTLAASPYSESLARRTASSSESNAMIGSTGPKVSSRMMSIS